VDRKALISRPDSRVALLVLPTDEESMIAQHTLALLPKHAALGTTDERLAG
jgi:acetate kinase